MVPMLFLVYQLLFVKLGKIVILKSYIGSGLIITNPFRRRTLFLIDSTRNLRFVFFRAAHSNLPLYQYIAKLSTSNIRLPVPAFNV